MHSCVVVVPFEVTNACGWSKSQKLPPKADNTFDGHCPQNIVVIHSYLQLRLIRHE